MKYYNGYDNDIQSSAFVITCVNRNHKMEVGMATAFVVQGNTSWNISHITLVSPDYSTGNWTNTIHLAGVANSCQRLLAYLEIEFQISDKDLC